MAEGRELQVQNKTRRDEMRRDEPTSRAGSLRLVVIAPSRHVQHRDHDAYARTRTRVSAKREFGDAALDRIGPRCTVEKAKEKRHDKKRYNKRADIVRKATN